MNENKEMATDELLEWARLNKINMSEGQAKDIIKDGEENIDLDEWFKQNNMTPIGEYESLSKKMKAKIQTIISSLKADGDKVLEDSNETEENDGLDEKDGKEQLDEDKKEQVEKEKQEKGEESPEDAEKDKEELTDEDKEDKQNDEQEETPKKDEYLARVKKLHEMKIKDYKDQMRKDDPKVDKYFIAMMYLQRNINRQRAAFIKEYGDEELRKIENDYLKEELKYEKTLNMRMEKDLSKLRALDQKLDSILDRMQILQKGLEDGNISLEEYNDEINSLEKDKLDTLWQINRLNPELLEQKQENIKLREKYEKRISPENIAKKKALSPENKAKVSAIEYSEKKQDGVAEKINQNIKDTIMKDVDEKEERLEELRKELKGIDITTPEGKKKALETIGEIQTLEAQKMSQEKQLDNLEKNMSADVQDYSDLKSSEREREDTTEEYGEMTKDIKVEEVSDDLMSQLRSQALDEPSTPEQAEQYLDNLNEISEQADKEQEQIKENDDIEPPTLLNRRKRPF